LEFGYGFPGPFIADAARYPLDGAPGLLGMVLAEFAFQGARRTGANVQTWKPSAALVTGGRSVPRATSFPWPSS